jgi:hypothetical protein
VAHPQIAVFARLADGNAKRLRAIEGQKTQLGRTMHGMGYDAVRDEIVVPQQFGQAILVFRGDSTGEQPPVRVIQGPKTRLTALDRVAVDAVNGEYYAPEGGSVFVFPRDATGNVAPTRVLGGPNTGFSAARAITVDTTRNLLIIVGRGIGPRGGNQISIFDRTASGDAKPLRVITGIAASQNVTVDPDRGLIFVVQLGTNTGYVGVWGVEDSGAVPPRFVIGGPNGTLFDPRGVVLDTKNQIVMVSDKQLNAVLSYSVPAIFESQTTSSQQQAAR